MTLIRIGYLATFAAALALPAPAQTTASSAQTAKPASLDSPKAIAVTTAPTYVKPAGLKGQPIAVAPQSASVPLKPKAPGSEGIQVHGHWIIDLRNADGSVAEHRDFENALQAPTTLLQIVTGLNTVGDLGIIAGTSGSGVCANSGFTGVNACSILASATQGLGFASCGGLVAGVCNFNLKEVVDNTSTGNITLTGTMPVVVAGQITSVGTQIFTCTPAAASSFSTIDPSGCYNLSEAFSYGYGSFTGTTIASMSVSPGQTIAFSVTLSFS